MTRGKHTSLHGKSDRVVKKIEDSSLVRKVVLGRSTGKTHGGHSDGDIKIQAEVLAGLKILIYSSKGVTEAVVICEEADRPKVVELIEGL